MRFWLPHPWRYHWYVSWGTQNFLSTPLIWKINYWWFHWIVPSLWNYGKCEVLIYLCSFCLHCYIKFFWHFLVNQWILFSRPMVVIFWGPVQFVIHSSTSVPVIWFHCLSDIHSAAFYAADSSEMVGASTGTSANLHRNNLATFGVTITAQDM